jgi:glutathione S-transferase
VFFERIVKAMRSAPADDAKVTAALNELPTVCGYLEQQLAAGGFGGSTFTLADIAIATQFVNLQHAGEQIDGNAFPKLAAFVARTLARPSFAECVAQERQVLSGKH